MLILRGMLGRVRRGHVSVWLEHHLKWKCYTFAWIDVLGYRHKRFVPYEVYSKN